MENLKAFFMEEDGLGTVEVIILIIVLVGLAMLFKSNIEEFVTELFGNLEADDYGVDNLD